MYFMFFAGWEATKGLNFILATSRMISDFLLLRLVTWHDKWSQGIIDFSRWKSKTQKGEYRSKLDTCSARTPSLWDDWLPLVPQDPAQHFLFYETLLHHQPLLSRLIQVLPKQLVLSSIIQGNVFSLDSISPFLFFGSFQIITVLLLKHLSFRQLGYYTDSQAARLITWIELG